MMAVAEQLSPDVDCILFTLSAALPIPVEAGLRVEHLASAGYLDVTTNEWHELLEDRVEQLITHYQPDVVVFDGVHPYRGLTSALGRRRLRRRPHRVWMRRAMWRPGVGDDTIQLAEHFDEVIEPGEYGAAFDHGATSKVLDGVHHIPPICYVGPNGELDRASACAELDLDAQALNVMVQLGAGTINDLDSTLGSLVGELQRVGARPCLALSVLSAPADNPAGDPADNPAIVRQFPISRYFAAFDFAAIATGYNSFHEALSLGLPSIFVPNLATKTDDQDARSRWASEQGLGLRWDGSDEQTLRAAVATLTDSEHRAGIRTRLTALPAADGSRAAAQLIEGWL
jgi:UDP-N-acetylglucosamine--N-acetylmuramyl-(pentapeptide) pyrophosphoryl-undecaprenol N-acetylglucosamine transferase|tara:strand:- start:932 stop:1960 length:1029 start_codon:yes stop_codon:yes gene_type:complete